MFTKLVQRCNHHSALLVGGRVPGLRSALLNSPERANVRESIKAAASSTYVSSTETTGQADAKRVVIIGGGFGGLYAAIRLSTLYWPKNTTPQITVVDKSDRFTFKPLLYELLNNSATEDEVAPYFTQLLAPYPVRFVQAKVQGVEEEVEGVSSSSSQGTGGKVQLEGGATLDYDWLVVALGSAADSKGISGVKELALPFNVYDDAVKVKEALESIESAGNPSSTIMVVGAGYAGVELATVVAERMRGKARVKVVTPTHDILDGCPEGQREAANKVLASLGAEVLTGTKVKQLYRPAASSPDFSASLLPTSCMVEVQQGEGSSSDLAADLVLWTAGSSPVTKEPAARKGLPFPTSSRGSVQTEPTLRVREHPRVFALGDVSVREASYEEQGTAAGSAASTSSALPATAQVAFQQADYVAWNLWASINGRTLLPFRYQHLGSMMSLGRLNAAVALPVPVPLPVKTTLQSSPLGPLLDAAGIKLDGSGGDSGVTLEGPLAAVMRRAAYLYRQPTNEQRLNVASSWLQQALSVAGSGAGRK